VFTLLGLVPLASIGLALIGPVASGSAAEGRLGPATPPIPKTKIACFNKQVGRFSGERQPANCEVAGVEGGENHLVKFPLSGIKWEKWGRFRSLTSLLSNFEQRGDVYRVVAFRRVECADRQVWYSRANVLDGRGENHLLRLPVCSDPGIGK
jgi:hypothetical protein